MTTPNDLKLEFGYWYLATPYSKYPDGIQAAFEDAATNTAALVRQGIPVFSPIAHTHPVAVYGGIDPYDHSIWIPADKPLMEAAHGLLVCKMKGWEESYGIKVEIEHFEAAGKPVHYLEDANGAN